MRPLDSSSILYTTATLSLVITLILAAMRRGYPRSIGGLGEWARGGLLMFLASMVFSQRGEWPDFVTVVIANGLLWGGCSLCFIGLCRFAERPVPQQALACAWAVSIAAMAGATLSGSPYPIKAAINASFSCGLLLAGCAVIWTIRPHNLAVRFGLICHGVAACIFGFRAVWVLLGFDTTLSLSDPTPIQTLFLVNFGVSGALNTLCFLLLANERLHNELRYAAYHDALTDTLNRGCIMDRLGIELERAQRYGHPLSVLLIDLDHFKGINDRHGHLAGDLTLVHFAAGAKAQLRRFDLLGRYGGEEFLTVLPQADATVAAQVAERIRQYAAAGGATVPEYTVSIGTASTTPDLSLHDLLQQADRALYRAKNGGRNRVECAALIPAESCAAVG
ncbi:MAG TPA: GGDEF domain-containing protein [Rhodocyclaceae bacterium]